jgi:RHS repeat-associated protein
MTFFIGAIRVIGEASENPFQFTGREKDETGLYYYRARYYSPEMGRFISEDPIGLPGGMNFYLYTINSPVNLNDPFGLLELGGPKPLLEGGNPWADWPSSISMPSTFTEDKEVTKETMLVMGGMVATPVVVALAAESASTAFYYLLTNPEMFMTASEFLVGATPGTPPPTEMPGYLGAFGARLYPDIVNVMENKCKNK